MFRPAIPLAASLLLLGACATTDDSTATTDASAAEATAAAEASTSTDATATTGSASTDATTTTNTAATGCNADAARGVVGQVASTQVIEQARTAAGAETARTLAPGQAVTMEFNGNRLNLDVDAGNTITNVRCG